MEMEFMAESVAGTSGDRGHQINRRKRTNHCKPCSPLGMAEATSTSSSGGGERSSTGSGACMINYYTTDQSQTLSSEEEEDMANCLIMLAQSVSPAKEDKSDLRCQKTEKFKSRRLTEIAATDGGKSGFLVYECKTCNRAFPSFQALGGHRASHKKPKPAVEERNSTSMELSEEDQTQLVVLYKENRFTTNKSPSPAPGFLQTGYNNNKGKIHECSICGSEFLSGQALGGHMRRHRIAPPSSNQISISTNTDDRFANHIIKKSPMLSLDLNLPAPEVADDVPSNFQFTASSPPAHLVFSAPALVDCHY